MDRVGPSQIASGAQLPGNIFSVACLDLTFRLLRREKPQLALLIQNILEPARHEHGNDFYEQQLSIELAVDKVCLIVEFLAETGEAAAHNQQQSKEELIAIRSVLLDWLLYAQSFEPLESSTDKNQIQYDPQQH